MAGKTTKKKKENDSIKAVEEPLLEGKRDRSRFRMRAPSLKMNRGIVIGVHAGMKAFHPKTSRT